MSSAKTAGAILLVSTLVVLGLAALTSTSIFERTSLSSAPEPSRHPGDPFRVAAQLDPPGPHAAAVKVRTSVPAKPVPAEVLSERDSPALAKRNLLIPVAGITRAALRDNFNEMRGRRRHEALDIMAARGTPVYAVDHGRVTKLFRSVAGGITVYQFDPDERFAYYYAHLDRYADGLAEGKILKRGDLVGYVGSTGNAPAHAPHLHFTIFVLGPDKRWWKGEAVNPYPYLLAER